VTAIDASAKTVTRLLASNNRTDTFSCDQARDGLRYRGLNTCSIAGVTSNWAEFVQLPLQGMGITLTMSVGQPHGGLLPSLGGRGGAQLSRLQTSMGLPACSSSSLRYRIP